MPIQLTVDAYPGFDPEAVRTTSHAVLMRQVLDELAARRYQVGAIIDRAGNFSRGRIRRAMSQEELDAANQAVARYAAALRRPTGAPADLGLGPIARETGSDATLFIGGDAYLGDQDLHMEDVLAALRVAGAMGTVAGATAAMAGKGSTEERAGRALDIIDAGTEQMYRIEEAEAALPPRPPRLPSRLRLTLTLVDNRTGQVLWHADRALHVDPTEGPEVQRAVRVTARKLPCGAATPRVKAPRSLRPPDRAPPCRA